MSRAQDLDPIARCEALFAGAGFLTLDPIFAAAGRIGTATDHGIDAAARALCEAYNHSAESRARLARAARAGDAAAANTLAWMETQGLDPAPCRPLAPEEARILHGRLEAEPEGFLNRGLPYPASVADRHWGFAPGWTGDRLALGRARLDRMRAGRRGDVAVLVGNGPSLRQTDLTLLAGQEVFISNYALRHPVLGQLAQGVGVSNYFVAAQAPQLFHPVFRDRPVWRVLPVWLGHVLADSPETIWLNATGGGLFFSEAPERRIAWHATVSFLWMQVLLALGYRKVVLIGFDHSYAQPAGVREGTVLRQQGDDPNHFDPGYFRDRLWQAADVDHMAAAYVLARRHYEARGAEIVNCTAGGALEVFRRGHLAEEIGRAGG